MQTDGYNAMVVGNQPLSYPSRLISARKSQGGDQARKEFQQSLETYKA